MKYLKDLFKNKQRMQTLIFMIIDIIIVNVSFFAALFLRFDFIYSEIPKHYLNIFVSFAPLNSLFVLFIFSYFKLYRMVLQYVSYTELFQITIANLASIAFHVIGITLIFGRMPISYYFFGYTLQYGLTVFSRFFYRFFIKQKESKEKLTNTSNLKNTMIIGAGSAGELTERDISRTKETNYNTQCFIDDDKNKWGRYISGIPIVGGRDLIKESVEKYKIDTILFAIPSVSSEDKKEILNICKDTGCELKTLPGFYQLVSGEVTVSNFRNVDIQDLLGREPIKLLDKEKLKYIKNKTVLVTGGGGSIGSELCRQIAEYNPKLLLIFDIYENNAYDIENELKYNYPELKFKTLIGSVRDFPRLQHIFQTYRPDIVYHAAAHKHVPLMEDSPMEAIKNNVAGTYYTALASLIYGTQRFLLISTDKAVNPTNIMGASKRIAEKIVQSMDTILKEKKYELLPKVSTNDRGGNVVIFDSNNIVNLQNNFCTEFVAVRFGNVLGSNGSVIPLFKRQIENGGPVTVTHPNVIRYFMTIEEAVSLVLQAGNMAKGGEIFVLDMGEPVKIDLLARNLIKLSGMIPDEDIRVVYTGLRPGEKLFEEKLMAEEGLEKTENDLIHIAHPIEFDINEFYDNLKSILLKNDLEKDYIIGIIEKLVPTFSDPDIVNKKNELLLEKFLESINVN